MRKSDGVATGGTGGADIAGATDVGELYRLCSENLLRIVGAAVRAPDPVIEDACQFAWSRLVRHRERVHRETALAWLVTTAMHEAVKLLRRAGRDVSLETAVEQGVEIPPSRPDPNPHLLVEERERLRSLAALPARQQRLLWLYGVGLSYEEIARTQGCSSRTVERQLNRARTTLKLREISADAAAL